MRALIIAASAVLVAGIAWTQPAAAGPQRWCYQNNDSWYVDCSEPSFQTCMFSTYGAGGYCYLDTADRPPYRTAAASWRPQAYAEEPHWNWGPSYQSYRAQPAYYAPSYQAYQPFNWGWNPQPAYMNPYAARPGSTRWCYTNSDGNTTNCSQPSFEMCEFSTYGTGGHCYQEQAYFGPSRLRAATLHAHHRSVARNEKPISVADAADTKRRAEEAFASAVPDAGKPSTPASAPAVVLADASVTDAPLTLSPVRAAVAPATLRDLPHFNVEAACRRAAQIGLDAAHDAAACLQDENEARDQLIGEWNAFAASDRASCTRMTGSAGGGTYTELVTCLEMSPFAHGSAKSGAAALTASR